MIGIRGRGLLLAWACAVPFLIITILFEIMPILAVVSNSVFKEGSLSFANYAEILTGRFYLSAFRASFTISIITASIGLAIALPIAIKLAAGAAVRVPQGAELVAARVVSVDADVGRVRVAIGADKAKKELMIGFGNVAPAAPAAP